MRANYREKNRTGKLTHEQPRVEKKSDCRRANPDRVQRPGSTWLPRAFVVALLAGLYCFNAMSVTFAQMWVSRGPEGGQVRAFAIDPVTRVRSMPEASVREYSRAETEDKHGEL